MSFDSLGLHEALLKAVPIPATHRDRSPDAGDPAGLDGAT
jgi:hypothetical protein